MNKKNNGHRMVSIREVAGKRQANNLLDFRLADVVRPWFSGDEQQKYAWAFEAIDHPRRRAKAAASLGLEILPAM